MAGNHSSLRGLQGHGLRGLQRGFNMIELMVGVAIVGMVLFFMIPGMGAWLQSSQIRNATESIQGAMQLARVEAVRRNTNVQLVLTSLAGGGTASDWSVNCVTPTASCPGAGMPQTEIEKRPAGEGSPNAKVTVTPAMSTFVFSGTGRLTPLPAGNIVIDVTHQKANSCLAGGGEYRCLRLVVSPGGQARMCDPALVAPNPRAC
jgi:type IV fimbrial biogenesis protein FimT